MTVDSLPISVRYSATGNMVTWLERGESLGRLLNRCRGRTA